MNWMKVWSATGHRLSVFGRRHRELRGLLIGYVLGVWTSLGVWGLTILALIVFLLLLPALLDEGREWDEHNTGRRSG